MTRLCMSAALLLTTEGLLAVSSGSIIAASLADRVMPAVINDSKGTGALPKGIPLVWTSLNQPVVFGSREDNDILSEIADEPLGRPVGTGPWTVSSITDLALRYHRLPKPTITKRRAEEQIYYRRIINRRNPWLLRVLGIVPEYPANEEPYEGYSKYLSLRDAWVAAVDRRNKLRSSNADLKEIALAEADVAAAREAWDIEGNRKVFTVVLARVAFFEGLNPELLWKADEDSFLAEGGVLFRSTGKSLPVVVDPRPEDLDAASNAWRSLDFPASDGDPAVHLSYVLARFERNWLDYGIFFFNKWGWDRSSPVGQDLLLSGSGNCDEPNLFLAFQNGGSWCARAQEAMKPQLLLGS